MEINDSVVNDSQISILSWLHQGCQKIKADTNFFVIFHRFFFADRIGIEALMVVFEVLTRFEDLNATVGSMLESKQLENLFKKRPSNHIDYWLAQIWQEKYSKFYYIWNRLNNNNTNFVLFFLWLFTLGEIHCVEVLAVWETNAGLGDLK